MNEKQPQHNLGEQPEDKQNPWEQSAQDNDRESEDTHERERNYERQPQRNPQVWIGSLADYNNGTLTGDWVDAAVEDEELVEAAKRIVASSQDPSAEEWGIFDYDDFGDFRPGQYEQLEIVAKVARGIQEHGDAFAFWAQLHDADPSMLDSFDDSYLGEYESAGDWAREVLGEADIERRIEHEFGEELGRYIQIDYEAWARDASLGGEVHLAENYEGGIWVFRVE